MDIRLLGPLTVTDSDGEAVPVPGERQRVLLALLALESPRAVSSDAIVEALWSRKLPEKPEAALHIAVSRLRGVLGRGAVETVEGGYRLSTKAVKLDLNRFREYASRGRQLMVMGDHAGAGEAFRQALAQWRGVPLSGMGGFEFAEGAARRLDEERLVILEEMLEAEIAAGRHTRVLSDLTGLVESFPLRERLWELLMVALYRSGRQAEALRAFSRARDILATELGVDPSPELAALEEKILMHDLQAPEPSAGRLRQQSDARQVETLHFEPGDVIVEQGSIADEIYWIEEGRAEAYRADGAATVIGELSAGQYFGELSSLLGIGRTASVRATTSVVVSAYSPEAFRARLASQSDILDSENGVTAGSVRELIRRGDYLRAFDRASRGVQQQPGDPLLRYLAVLSLARAGATSRAREAFESHELGRVDLEELSPSLAIDIAALPARLEKDLALRAADEEREEWARRSSETYRRAHERFGSSYLLVNAATMALVAGDGDLSVRDASGIVDEINPEDELGYWHLATLAEAALLLGDTAAAETHLRRASEAEGADAAARSTTLRQLRMVCDILGTDPSILGPIENPTVVHFCGHMADSQDRPGPLRDEDVTGVKEALAETFQRLGAGVGYGSLASGADILAAEALLERGGDLHVVLPFAKDEFVERSVAPAGEAWVERFEACLEQAHSVDYATVGEYLGDDVLFEFCAGIAMGEAVIHAEFLQTDVHQVAVWDGQEPVEAAGTARDVARWKKAGLDATIIPVEPRDGVRPARSSDAPGRSVRFLLFADFAGFSTLSDRRILRFQAEVMEKVARTIDMYRDRMLSGRTWGDGLYLVFDTVEAAADCALALQAAVGGLDFSGLDLDGLRGLRVAAHATPVFDGWDPISDTRLIYGMGVTQVARVEPRTPEGEVYVTKEFAALAMLTKRRTFETQYVGTVPTAKGYGPLPLFSLSRSG